MVFNDSYCSSTNTARTAIQNFPQNFTQSRPQIARRSSASAMSQRTQRFSVPNAYDFLLRRITLNRAAAVSFARRFETEARLGPRGASWRRLAICSVCHAGATYLLPRRVCEGIQHVCVGIRRQPKCCCRRSFGRSVGRSLGQCWCAWF